MLHIYAEAGTVGTDFAYGSGLKINLSGITEEEYLNIAESVPAENQFLDDSDSSITRNTTTLRMRKDFAIVASTASSYEICFEQALATNTGSSVVYSTGFQLDQGGVNDARTYYFEDDGLGNI